MITVFKTQEGGLRPRVILTGHTIEDVNFAIAEYLRQHMPLFLPPKPHHIVIDGHDELTGEYIFEEV